MGRRPHPLQGARCLPLLPSPRLPHNLEDPLCRVLVRWLEPEPVHGLEVGTMSDLRIILPFVVG